jgi:hypothetical protein
MTTASEKREALTAILNDRRETLIVVAVRKYHFEFKMYNKRFD